MVLSPGFPSGHFGSALHRGTEIALVPLTLKPWVWDKHFDAFGFLPNQAGKKANQTECAGNDPSRWDQSGVAFQREHGCSIDLHKKIAPWMSRELLRRL